MNLRDYLIENCITVKEFAKQIGYDKGHISRIVHGRKMPGEILAVIIERATHGQVKRDSYRLLDKDKEKI